MRTASEPRCQGQTSRWPTVERTVLKLPKRLERAAPRGADRAVRRRQKRLRRSHEATLLAVRQVTQDARGQKTPGVDGIAALTPAARRTLAEPLPRDGHAAPVRRVSMPTPGTRSNARWAFPPSRIGPSQAWSHKRWSRNGKPGSNPIAMAFARDVVPGMRSERSMSRSTRNRHGSWRRTSPKASIASTTTPCDASSTPSQGSAGSSTRG